MNPIAKLNRIVVIVITDISIKLKKRLIIRGKLLKMSLRNTFTSIIRI